MKLNHVVLGVAVAVSMCVGSGVPTANAIHVNSEIMLLADTSGSVDSTDFNLERQGYASAFQSAAVQNAIATFGPIAVSLVYWSDSQQVAVPWTLISDAASANAFAAAILAAPRNFSGGTGMSSAMNFGRTSLLNNGYEGTHVVMDVSGDGAERDGVVVEPAVQAARDAALAAGITQINALWIQDRTYFGVNPGDSVNALDYGNNNVLGGAGAFELMASDWVAFQTAVQDKIGREVNPTTPDGGTTSALLGLALMGLGVLRRMMK